MKIPLKNTILEIKIIISKKPKIKKLEKELKDFFSKNKIEGFRIKKFEIVNEGEYAIAPIEPYFEETLRLGTKYEKELEKIGKKYGIDNFGFEPYCYGK
ncbi:hypothetical protein M0R19_00250 [Candidatus Pacearchaeota archaeon]|jgi:hypothetical protein|nr:hypothetical protein [Candidatus Pacearchaeota archaeon]